MTNLRHSHSRSPPKVADDSRNTLERPFVLPPPPPRRQSFGEYLAGFFTKDEETGEMVIAEWTDEQIAELEESQETLEEIKNLGSGGNRGEPKRNKAQGAQRLKRKRSCEALDVREGHKRPQIEPLKEARPAGFPGYPHTSLGAYVCPGDTRPITFPPGLQMQYTNLKASAEAVDDLETQSLHSRITFGSLPDLKEDWETRGANWKGYYYFEDLSKPGKLEKF